MTGVDIAFVNDLLSALEDRELPLLSWGVTTGALSEDEVLATIADALHRHPKAPRHLSFDVVLQHLLDRALLYPISDRRGMRYRTRIAEALRLTANLRQLFAPRWSDQQPAQWWTHGRRLVADYRLHVAPRKYPSRDVPLDQARAELSAMPGWGSQQDHVFDTLVAGRDMDLARFQVEACRTIFEAIRAEQSGGVLVSAGTGSGKTLAAYLPAFASMAGHEGGGVHMMAIYPRVELLRDQVAEAVRNAARLRDILGRPLRVGVLYGDTPHSATDAYQFSGNRGSWRQIGHGSKDFRCPFLPCPACGVAELVWPHADRTAPTPRERLRCVSCGHEITAVEVVLTRASLTARPPDLLFTTTEMLNRNSTAPDYATLLGWRPGYGPAVVLLDEVHTYVGMHGAQVALLLRRWRHAARTPSTFVGLSATLRDGERFFASLTGLPASRVNLVAPKESDLERDGREYAIALRGDPVAGASLLSTSIQTAMLFGRVLDTEQYLFGTTGFVFTDDLDVTNRFYDDLRDAEGHQNRGMHAQGRRTVLAALRSSHRPEASARDRDGQLWQLVENIGHHLAEDLHGEHLRVGRTSSQDTGTNRNADLIVASPSLEVGVDDPRVGLVMQHKAPRDAAAFIQRRGRAGRARETRPISVVVLSEYGRDRVAYQAYETLFSPELTRPNLPIGNRFVQKIQATQALLDWLGIQVRHQFDPRVVLRAPRSGDGSASAVARRQRDVANRAVASVLRKVLENAVSQDDLTRHLGYALRLDAGEIQAILWEQPRSLMLSVIPTVLRRLESGWRPLREDAGAAPSTLLPEFLTSTLFNPLNVPEVEFILPFESQPESLEIGHALREAVPGRVSKRYGYQHDNDRSWIAPPPDGGHELDLLSFVDNGLSEGEWCPFGGEPVTVVRPLRLRLAAPPPEVRTQSQGMPRWGSDIVLPDDVELNPADIPDPSPWSGRLAAVGFAAHVSGNPVEVRRMSLGADCAIQHEGDANEDRRQVSYTLRGRPAALGFRLDTDGIRVGINPPDLTTPETQAFLASPQWRTLAFQEAVRAASGLADITNGFQRDWLAQIYLTGFAMTGATGDSGAQIHAQLASGSWRDDLPAILSVMYRGGEHPTDTSATDRLVARLSGLAANQTVVDILNTAGELLFRSDIGVATAPLAQRVYTSTLAAALSATAIRACPHAQDRDLMVDVLPGATAAEADVLWLTETSIGGVGVIEYLIQYYAADPRAFWALVDTSLAPGEYEYVDGAMVRLLREVRDDPRGAAAQAIARLRTAGSAADADTALHDLRTAWAAFDSAPRHSAIATLSTRLLRPGSTIESDAAALRMIEAWTELETMFGVEVDARVVAYLAGERRLGTSSNGDWPLDLTADQAFSLLWPRGQRARNQHLHHYQPYAESAPIERLLVAAVHADRVQQIDLATPDWVREYQTALATHAQVDLVAHGANRVVADALVRIPILPVDRDVLRLYGEIRAVTRHADRTSIRVEIREAVQ